MARVTKLTEEQFFILSKVKEFLDNWLTVLEHSFHSICVGYNIYELLGDGFLCDVAEAGLSGLTFHALNNWGCPTFPIDDDWYEYMSKDEQESWEKRAEAEGEGRTGFDLWCEEAYPKFDKGMDTIYDDLSKFFHKYEKAYMRYIEDR